MKAQSVWYDEVRTSRFATHLATRADTHSTIHALQRTAGVMARDPTKMKSVYAPRRFAGLMTSQWRAWRSRITPSTPSQVGEDLGLRGECTFESSKWNLQYSVRARLERAQDQFTIGGTPPANPPRRWFLNSSIAGSPARWRILMPSAWAKGARAEARRAVRT